MIKQQNFLLLKHRHMKTPRVLQHNNIHSKNRYKLRVPLPIQNKAHWEPLPRGNATDETGKEET